MIGKKMMILLTLCTGLLDASQQPKVTLRLQSALVCIGTPCTVELRAQGFTHDIAAPELVGVPKRCLIGCHQQIEVSSINGKHNRAVCWIYTLRFDKAGTYHIEPVTLQTDTGALISSASLTINVTADHPAQQTVRQTQSATFAKWKCEQTNPYAGELVPVALKLYTTDSTLEVEGSSPIESTSLLLELDAKNEWTQEVYNGTPYRVCEWKGTVTAAQAGIYALPELTIIGVADNTKEQHLFGFMASLMGSMRTQRPYRVPAVSLSFAPLPPSPEENPSIGTAVIQKAEWSLKQKAIAQGEAVVLTRKLIGTYASTLLQLPEPVCAHNRIKMYHSHTSLKGSFPLFEREDEYIIQGLLPGQDNIKAQHFSAFNPQTKQYDLFNLPMITLSITPSAQPATSDEATTGLMQAPEEQSNITKNNIHQPAEQVSAWMTFVQLLQQALYRPLINLTTFILLLCVMLAIKIKASFFERQIRRFTEYWHIVWRKRKALEQMRAAIAARDAYALFYTFCDYVDTLVSGNKEQPRDLLVQCWLLQRNVNEQCAEEWLRFYYQLEEHAFTLNPAIEWSQQEQMVQKWIMLLASLARKQING